MPNPPMSDRRHHDNDAAEHARGVMRPWWYVGALGTAMVAGLWWYDAAEIAEIRQECRANALTNLAHRRADLLVDVETTRAEEWRQLVDRLPMPKGVQALVVDVRQDPVAVVVDRTQGKGIAYVRARMHDDAAAREDGTLIGWSAIGTSGRHVVLIASPDADVGVPDSAARSLVWVVALVVMLSGGVTMGCVVRNRQRRVNAGVRARIVELDRQIRAVTGEAGALDAPASVSEALTAVADVVQRTIQRLHHELREQQRRVPAWRIEEVASILDAQTVPVFIKDRTGGYLYANAAFLRLMHREEQGLVGRRDEDIMPEAWARICRQTDEAVFTSGLSTVTEEFVANGEGDNGGRWALIRKSPAKLPGGSTVIIGMITGLDDRRRSDQLTRQGELHCHDVFHHVRDSVLILEGEHGTIIDANRQAVALVRAEMSGIIGRTLSRVCADPTAADAWCRPAMDSVTQPSVQELVILADDGTSIVTEATASWLELPDGRHVTQVVLRDVSERQRALTEALAGQRAKTAFLATVSHELRTPLNGILGLADVLERGDLSDHQRELLKLLRASGVRLLELLTNVLEYARLDAESGASVTTLFSPRVLIEDVVAALAVAASLKHLELSVAVAAEVPAKVLGDPARVRLVLHHLIANAVKFTAAGSVGVAVRVVSQDEHRVRLACAITDTGIGIPAERCTELFKPFMQGDGSSTRGYEGLGLGLAIVERAVMNLGGTVAVASTPGGGSTFTVEWSFALPAAMT